MGSKLVHKLLECLKCGNQSTIIRKVCKNRSINHKKRMFCFVCGKRTLHIEKWEV